MINIPINILIEFVVYRIRYTTYVNRSKYSCLFFTKANVRLLHVRILDRPKAVVEERLFLEEGKNG